MEEHYLDHKVQRLEQETLRQKRLLARLEGLTNLKEKLIYPGSLEERANLITQEIVRIFDADFVRIWLVGPGDKCETGCFHDQFTDGPHFCANREKCLRLVASSGRYTRLDGKHARIPLGAYKIGLIGTGALPEFLTNDVTNDPRVHGHQWAKELGMVSFFGHRLLSEDGKALGVLGLFSQHAISQEEHSLLKSMAATITQVIHATATETALRESEARLRNVFENMQDCFYRTDINGTVIWASPSTPKLLGYTLDEILGKEISQVFYYEPSDRKEFLAALGVTGKVTDMEVRLRHKEGKPVWVGTNSAYFRDSKGAIAGVEGSFRDISQRKRRLEELSRYQDHLEEMITERTRALTESEQQYRALFENAGNAIFVLDENRIVDCNAKAEDLFKATRDTILRMTPIDFSPPAQPNGQNSTMLAKHYISKAFKGGPQHFEWKHQRHDGALFDAEVRLNTVTLRGKSHIIATIADITQRKEAEAQRTMLTTVLESTSDMVSFSTADLKITYINPAGKRMLGLEADQHPEYPYVQEAHPLWAREIVGNIGVPAAAKEGHWVGETALIGPDGREIPTSQVIMSHKDAEGRIEYFSTIIRDISGPKQAEEELERLRDFLTSIIDSMPSVLVGVDELGKITRWNRKTQAMAGKSFSEVKGKNLADVFPQFSNLVDMVKQAIERQKISEQAKIPVQFQGSQRYWDMTVYPLSESAMKGAVIRVDDVTERVRLEEMMIQSEKMMSVGGLAAGMAHEINNPLAGIIQNVQVLEKRLGPSLQKNHAIAKESGTSIEAIQTYLEKRDLNRVMEAIRESGGRAAAIVNNMLDFSRKGDSAFLPQDLCKVVDQTIELASSDFDLKKQYDFRQIQITRNYQSPMPQVRCEKTKIQQVVFNLLQNAAQAMTGQRNTQAPPEIDIRISTEKDMALIEIRDNGMGMDESVRKRVFEPFFTTKELGVGTGLGLSVSYFIITENHKGAMQVESSPGRGAAFMIRLPLDRE
ncbi:MAG: PAS domain S-box protein [Desulfatibacillum sp.]|nr:PAS domain S-box protein [Desulfatibacillum sp.]